MKNRRIYVEKYSRFQVEADTLRNELNTNLGLSIEQLRYINVYDLFGFSDELLERSRYTVFGEVVTDAVTDECDMQGMPFLAVEFLPGQFDQRAASAVDCVHLIEPNAEVKIKSSRLYIFDKSVSAEDMARIEKYLINAVESRKKNLEVLSDAESAEIKPVAVLEGFRDMKDEELVEYCKRNGLAMNADDLREVVNYFRKEGRDPVETELRILDTYWSDHCRHTTFTTEIEEITIDESFMKGELESSIELMHGIRKELGREQKSLCLMELATIGARYLRKLGKLDDMEQSEENNACSIFVNVDVDGVMERWLLQFKNETHNHPTEIEPFGGASTCLGGAIRDPLSGRSYVYHLALSYSGETDEVLKIVPFIHSNGNVLISMTGNKESTLAKNSNIHLDVCVKEEACILRLAPTTSTTAQIAMGDALAVALMKAREFTAMDFARFHPGGSLGRRLLMRVGNVMRKNDLPVVAADCSATEMIHKMSRGGLGLIIIMDGEKIEGIVTDGDVRRAMESRQAEFFNIRAIDIATRSPKVVNVNAKLVEAEKLMTSYKVNSLLAVDDAGALQGVIQIYDIKL